MRGARYILPLLSLCVLVLAACSRNNYKARIILLPDTQYYAEKYPAVLDSQISWIYRNANNIDFVLQEGDLTQNNNDREWQVVQQAFGRLINVLPFVLALGNHDMGSGPGKFADERNTSLYNRYFPYEQISGLPGFGGSFEAGKTDNSYYLFQTGRIKWLVLSLEFGPRNAVLDWANGVVSAHADRTVMLNTHSYMYSDSTRQGPGDNWRPQAYGIGKDSGANAVNDGEQIWEKLVSRQPNIRFVFSGHVLNSGVGTLVSVNEHGNYVYQMLANYQSEVKGSTNGGNGYLRILDMDFKKKTLNVRTYSPYSGSYLETPGQHFLIRNVLFGPGAEN